MSFQTQEESQENGKIRTCQKTEWYHLAKTDAMCRKIMTHTSLNITGTIGFATSFSGK